MHYGASSTTTTTLILGLFNYTVLALLYSTQLYTFFFAFPLGVVPGTHYVFSYLLWLRSVRAELILKK